MYFILQAHVCYVVSYKTHITGRGFLWSAHSGFASCYFNSPHQNHFFPFFPFFPQYDVSLYNIPLYTMFLLLNVLDFRGEIKAESRRRDQRKESTPV